MSMIDWARKEIEIATKNENPEWDGVSFDYGCLCYTSALKAYELLCGDGHSGYSFNAAKNILVRLMNGLPLTPITEKDFENVSEQFIMSDAVQCPRMYTLFQKVNENGELYYTNIDRAYCFCYERPDFIFGGFPERIVDELFPIILPYYPDGKKYKVCVQSFLSDKNNGDFDTQRILYVECPDGSKVEVNRYYGEIDGKLTVITREEFERRLASRVDPIRDWTSQNIIWTFLENCHSEKENEIRKWINSYIPEEFKQEFREKLREKCVAFESEENFKYNTFNTIQSVCKLSCDDSYPEFILEIQELLKTYESELSKYRDNINIAECNKEK